MALITATNPDEVLPTSTVLIGGPKAGKSLAIANRILTRTPDAKVFWACFDNTRLFEDKPDLIEKWDVGVYSKWPQFEKQLSKLTAQVAPKYDVMVLDGIAALARLKLDTLTGTTEGAPSIAQWGQMSKAVHSAVRQLKDLSSDFYATVMLKQIDLADPNKKPYMPKIVSMFDLNADLEKRLLPEFGRVVFCYAEETADGVEYLINADAAALQFSTTQYA